MPTLCQRMWIVGDCPPEFNANAPATFGPGCVALAYGGTSDGSPPVEWFEGLVEKLGLGEAAASTICMRYVDAFAWTVFWDPSGSATPLEPRIMLMD